MPLLIDICVGMTWRRLTTTGAVPHRPPRLEDANHEVRQFRGRCARRGSRAREDEGTDATIIALNSITDCSNAFNTVSRPAVLEEVATCVPAITQFVANYYDERPTGVFFQMDSGEHQAIACSRRVQ